MPVTFPGGTLPIAGFYPGVAALSTTGSNAGHSLYAGTFDNVYYQSTGAPSGNIYVVGDTGVEGSGILYQVRIVGGGITTNGNFALVTALSSNTGGGSTSYPWPSPMTEFCNTSTGACNASGGVTTGGGKDYIFFSVNRGSKTGCTATVGNGCILAYNVTSETSTLPAAPATPAEVGSGLNVATPITNGCWATSGLVVDNGLATTGNSQVYFIGLGGNAAGGPTGTTQTNAACTAGTAGTIGATQASQVSP
jgi:hypothetical protein